MCQLEKTVNTFHSRYKTGRKGRHQTTNNMNSNLFKLNGSDFAKGAVMAVLAAVIVPIYTAASTNDFNALVSIDWAETGKMAFTAFLAYVLKNFLSDSNGKVLG